MTQNTLLNNQTQTRFALFHQYQSYKQTVHQMQFNLKSMFEKPNKTSQEWMCIRKLQRDIVLKEYEAEKIWNAMRSAPLSYLEEIASHLHQMSCRLCQEGDGCNYLWEEYHKNYDGAGHIYWNQLAEKFMAENIRETVDTSFIMLQFLRENKITT